ncbi:PTS sugar transporter subunit IIA [Cytobacillus dafuensis]|uniref:PTS glucose transporter subunit IIA n=1 Tax=Cytobacillus dafuensis TaxID=1742359 RepID=A0A5B8Z1G4_CYTDA|nr:PTS glucose transporter subunit IIA [Cytobacillus dafuensis]QED46840.1 PTS glucose transporter subunit IIA [Cytobacillus dafuensis]
MFSNLFKKRKLQIFAPVNGEVLSLDKVPDPVFSEKMMGEGVAIMPDEGNIHAPIEGTVILMPDTKHAIGIRSKDGTEILIHIGLETVSLKGNGFNTHVIMGDSISIGQLLIEVDWSYLKEHAESIITPIVITNSSDRVIQFENIKQGFAGETVLMTVSPL